MASEEQQVEYGQRVHPLLHLVAPVVAMGAIWIARQGLRASYEGLSGREAPRPYEQETPWARALLWTAATATTAAVIEVSVRRLADERVRRILHRGRPAAVDA